MEEDEKKEKLKQLEHLKILLKFHTENRVLTVDKQFLEYIDEILDEISRIENDLKNEEQE